MTASLHVVSKLLTVSRMSKVDYRNKVLPYYHIGFCINITRVNPEHRKHFVTQNINVTKTKMNALSEPYPTGSDLISTSYFSLLGYMVIAIPIHLSVYVCVCKCV